MAFSPDGKLLATASYDLGMRCYCIRVWEVASGKEVATLKQARTWCRGLAFSPNGTLLAAAVKGEPPWLFDTATWQVTSRLFVPRRPDLDKEGTCSIAFSPDGRLVAALRSVGGADFWEAATGKHRPELVEPDLPYKERLATGAQNLGGFALAFTPNSRSVAALTNDGVVLWSLTARSVMRMLKPGSLHPRALAVSADGKFVAAAYRGEFSPQGTEKAVLIWDLPAGKLRTRLNVGDKYGEAHAVAFSPDGRILAIAGTGALPEKREKEGAPLVIRPVGKVRLWHVLLGRDLAVLQADPRPLGCVAFSPDGRILAVSGGGPARLFDLPRAWPVQGAPGAGETSR